MAGNDGYLRLVPSDPDPDDGRLYLFDADPSGPTDLETAWFSLRLLDEEFEEQDEDAAVQWWDEPIVAVSVLVAFNQWSEDEDEVVEEEQIPSYFLGEVGFPFHGYALDEELDPESDEEYLQPLIFENAPFHFYFLDDEVAEDEDEVWLQGVFDAAVVVVDDVRFPVVFLDDQQEEELTDEQVATWFQGIFEDPPVVVAPADVKFVGFITNVGFLRG